MQLNDKEVLFNVYCMRCKHNGEPENETTDEDGKLVYTACHYCLNVPYRQGTRVPERFEDING